MQIPCVYLPGPAPAVSVANSNYSMFEYLPHAKYSCWVSFRVLGKGTHFRIAYFTYRFILRAQYACKVSIGGLSQYAK
jgi:hypothetical protein